MFRKRPEERWSAKPPTDEPGRRYSVPKKSITAMPTPREEQKPVSNGGPGTELRKLLSLLQLQEVKGCKCRLHALEMDFRGPQWCIDHKETILIWLQEEADRQGMPFLEYAASKVVDLAIRRSQELGGLSTVGMVDLKLRAYQNGQVCGMCKYFRGVESAGDESFPDLTIRCDKAKGCCSGNENQLSLMLDKCPIKLF